MNKFIRNNVFLLLTTGFIVSFSSCGWLDCRADGCLPYEFTLDYSILDFNETVTIGDTLTLLHEFPFVVEENKNGVEYDITGVSYDPGLEILRLGDGNTLLFPSEEDFTIISVGVGDIISRTHDSGYVIHNVEMLELVDKNVIEVQLIPHNAGEYILNFSFFQEERLFIDVSTDTCCSLNDMILDYDFISENSTASRFENDSIWEYENSLEVNLLENDRRFDYCSFVVEE